MIEACSFNSTTGFFDHGRQPIDSDHVSVRTTSRDDQRLLPRAASEVQDRAGILGVRQFERPQGVNVAAGAGTRQCAIDLQEMVKRQVISHVWTLGHVAKRPLQACKPTVGDVVEQVIADVFAEREVPVQDWTHEKPCLALEVALGR